MNVIDKLVFKNLKLNKKRTIVTLIGIILSVALLTSLSTLVSSFRGSIIEVEKLTKGNFHVKYSPVTEEQAKDILENRNIGSYYETENMGYGLLKESQNEYKPYVFMIGIKSQDMEKLYFNLLEGRYPENENEIVISNHIKTNAKVNYKVGDEITFEIGDRVLEKNKKVQTQNDPLVVEDKEMIINSEKRTYKVVGIIERPCYNLENLESPGYTCITCKENLSGSLNLHVRFTDKGMFNQKDTISQIEEMAEGQEYEYCINQNLINYESLQPKDAVIVLLYKIAAVIAFIIIFTSVYCIKNSFEISVSEKMKQNGMLASIGATGNQIKKSVLKEAGILGVVGIPVGLASGIFATFMLVKISQCFLREYNEVNFVFFVSPLAIGASIVLSIITIYFSARKSSRMAAKISPLEAIRSTREISISESSVKIPSYVKKIWGIGGVISYKNIKRNRRKYRTTVVSIAICTATFIVISYFTTTVFTVLHKSVPELNYNVSVSFGVKESIEDVVKRVEKLDNVEEFNVLKAELANVENAKFSKEMKDYLRRTTDYSENEIDDEEKQDYIGLIIFNQKQFDDYAEKCGYKEKDKPILINSEEDIVFVDNRVTYEYVKKYDVKVGDKLVLNSADYSNAEKDDDDNYIESTVKRIKYEAEVGCITEEYFLGKEEHKYPCLIMSSEMYEKTKFKSENNSYYAYFKSDDSDKLAEELTKNLYTEDKYTELGSVDNRDKEYRKVNSMYILVSILVYGLMTVIALIGITNIMNTITTNLELRSSEFAVLRSVGMTSDQFSRLARLESFFTGAKALLFGIVAGVLITIGINKIENSTELTMAYHLPIEAILFCVIVVMALIYIIIKTTLNRINKRNIIESIKATE